MVVDLHNQFYGVYRDIDGLGVLSSIGILISSHGIYNAVEERTADEIIRTPDAVEVHNGLLLSGEWINSTLRQLCAKQ